MKSIRYFLNTNIGNYRIIGLTGTKGVALTSLEETLSPAALIACTL